MLTLLLLACPAPPPPAAEPPPLPPDQTELEQFVVAYTDRSRGTPAIGDAPADDERRIETWVWIGPSAGALAPERPLVLLLHGVNGHPSKFEALATDLALAGLVVAAPAFPVSNGEVDGSELTKLGDLEEQVLDVGFLLDALLADVASDGPLYARFHPDRVIGMGHSMGGATLLGATRFGGGEPRIAAQVYVSAALQLLPLLEADGDPLQRAGPRTLVAHGLLDIGVPPAFGEQLYASIDDPRWYLGITDADHSALVESQETPAIPERDALQRAVLAVAEAVVGDADAPLLEVLDQLAEEGHEVW